MGLNEPTPLPVVVLHVSVWLTKTSSLLRKTRGMLSDGPTVSCCNENGVHSRFQR